jgi:ribosome modulation factor
MQAATSGESDGNVTKATFLQFYDEYTDVDAAVAEAVGMRKDLRARIKGAGLNLHAFDRARKEAEKSGERREAEDREYRRNLEWLGKPLGYQSTMGYPEQRPPANGDDRFKAADAAVSEHQAHQVSDAGHAAGLGGRARDQNPWTPGTFLHQAWAGGWNIGAEALAQSQLPSDAAPKRRGRPPGSRNRRRGNSGARV